MGNIVTEIIFVAHLENMIYSKKIRLDPKGYLTSWLISRKQTLE